jgi:hypothetical protein
MARRKGGLYLPLDVNFMDDPRIVRVGEKSAVLYLAMALACKRLGTDGRLEPIQVDRLHIPNWKSRLRPLLDEQLVHDFDDGYYTIAAWFQHNEPQSVLEARRRDDAARKRRTPPSGLQTDSRRIPSGIGADSERKRREVERSEVRSPSTLSVVDADCEHGYDQHTCVLCVSAVTA